MFPLCAHTNHGQLRISRHLWSFLVSPEQIHEEVSKAPDDFHFPDHHNKYLASLLVHCLLQNRRQPQSSLAYGIHISFAKITTVIDRTWDFSVLHSKSSQTLIFNQDGGVGKCCAYLLSRPHQLQLNYTTTITENHLKST